MSDSKTLTRDEKTVRMILENMRDEWGEKFIPYASIVVAHYLQLAAFYTYAVKSGDLQLMPEIRVDPRVQGAVDQVELSFYIIEERHKGKDENLPRMAALSALVCRKFSEELVEETATLYTTEVTGI